jgi:large-conductance mechanosensitive channel
MSILSRSKAGAAVITYGNLVQATINFVIVAFLSSRNT